MPRTGAVVTWCFTLPGTPTTLMMYCISVSLDVSFRMQGSRLACARFVRLAEDRSAVLSATSVACNHVACLNRARLPFAMGISTTSFSYCTSLEHPHLDLLSVGHCFSLTWFLPLCRDSDVDDLVDGLRLLSLMTLSSVCAVRHLLLHHDCHVSNLNLVRELFLSRGPACPTHCHSCAMCIEDGAVDSS